MTLEQMVNALVDKGHDIGWSMAEAICDYWELNRPQPTDEGLEECSVCRRTMRRIEYKYHYHHCE